jgi:hypothetical protein
MNCQQSAVLSPYNPQFPEMPKLLARYVAVGLNSIYAAPRGRLLGTPFFRGYKPGVSRTFRTTAANRWPLLEKEVTETHPRSSPPTASMAIFPCSTSSCTVAF